MNWTDECQCYGNGHEIFHIAQGNLKEEEISKALNEILGENGWAADGHVCENGAYFSTAKEDIETVAMEISKCFPNATVFGQDSWDYEGFVVCFNNGQPGTDYEAHYELFELTGEKDYFEIEMLVTADNGYNFTAGGGMCHKENIPMFNAFIAHGNNTAKRILTVQEKEFIMTYLDEYSGGTFTPVVNARVVSEVEEKCQSGEVSNSAQMLSYFYHKGIEAVESGILSFDELIGEIS